MRSSSTPEMRALRHKASKGDREAMYTLACCARALVRPGKAALYYKWATYWAEKSDENGLALAATLLGHLFSDSENPRYDLKTAERFYAKAYKNGHEYAGECLSKLRNNRGNRNRRPSE